MTMRFYAKNKVLHKAQKLSSTVQHITVGNGQKVPVQFIVPVQVTFGEHLFEFYCMVIDTPDSCQMVIGIKEMYELEASLNTRNRSFEFLNRTAPVIPTKEETIRPGQTRHIQVAVQFWQRLSGQAVMKVLIPNPVYTMFLEIKNNAASMYIHNRDNETLTLRPNTVMGIVDVRSIGYFIVQYEQLEKHLADKYHFPRANEVKNYLNKTVINWNKAI